MQEALGLVDLEPSAASGKGDPFIVRLGVERQVERQLDEENYLHRVSLKIKTLALGLISDISWSGLPQPRKFWP